MKKLTQEYNDERPWKKSFTGKNLVSKTIKIEAYDKDCGSPSQIVIEIEEVGEKQRKTMLGNLPKAEAIKLRDMLNQIEF
jgi:hypothetical protein